MILCDRSLDSMLAVFSAVVSAAVVRGQVNNLPEGFPAAKGRMTPTEEVSNDFAETYGNRNGNGNDNAGGGGSSSNGNAPSAGGQQEGGALHRNISQGQVWYRHTSFKSVMARRSYF